ncbi:MAG: YafY family protein [Chromatiales bacterium]|jgi:predicted DNA-binding transcriptional regulator YafY|nr:YafY family protein [Chromatiales bacterium]MDY0067524.1 YafY family protein [Steroidobacteraceae bacterium]
MNRAERIYRLHAILREARRPVSLQRLKEQLGGSRATLVRDIGYMRDFMDAPIVYDRDANGYRYDPAAPEFELPGLWFNDSELFALLACEQLLETVQPGLLTPYIGPLRGRIRRLLEQSGHSADVVTARVRLKPTARRQVDPERFAAIAAAVLNGRVLDMEYHGRERGAATQRRVHPARLLHYRDNWYLIAWCEQAQDLRTFSLDRIRQPIATERTARDIDDDALERHLGASFGIFTGEAKAWAVLRFSPRMARWVADESWHPDQIGHYDGDHYQLQVPYSDPRELLMDILKYGPEVEVIAPEELRREVVSRVREAAERYG